MPKLYMGPVVARAENVYDESRFKHVEGEVGVLKIYASERLAPGKHFAVFYYEPGSSPVSADPDSFVTSLYFKTSCSTLEIAGDLLALTNPRGGVYRFRVLETRRSDSAKKPV